MATVKKGSIYLVQSLRPEGVDYGNGKWHWSEALGYYYTHSKKEAEKAGWAGRIYNKNIVGGTLPR